MNAPINQTQQRDREMTDYLYQTLRMLPQDIGGIDAQIASLVNAKREAEQRMEDAELNAQLSGDVDGKNDTERKLKLKAAVSKDPAYRAAQKEVNNYQSEIELQQAEAGSKRREFQAAIALAELHAARINMMTKLQNTKDIAK